MNIKTFLRTHDVTQSEFARGIGVTPALVWQWINGLRPIAPKHAIPIERFTAGKVTRSEICPDVYPPGEYDAA